MPIKIKWEGEITKIRKDLHTLQKENVKLREKLRGVATEAKKGAKGQDELARAAKRVYREIETPAERYSRKMKEFNRLLKAGTIKEHEFGRAGQRARNQLADSTVRINRLQDRARSGAASWAGRLASVVGSYVSLRAVIGGVTRALEDQDEMRRKSRDLTKSLGDVQRDTLLMLGAVPQQEREAFIVRMKGLAAKARPEGGIRTVYQTMSKAISAAGGDVGRAEAVTRQAARLVPQSAESMAVMAEAAVHLSKATKDIDPRVNLGFLLGVTQAAAVSDPAKVAKFGARGILGIAGKGGTAQEAGAIWAAITQAAPDIEGRLASTAGIRLAEQLDEYFLGKREDLEAFAKAKAGEDLSRLERERVERISKQDKAGGYLRVEAPKMTPLEMIRYMRDHPETRAEFMTGASFEALTSTAVEQLLGVKDRGDEAWQSLQEGLPKMVKGQEAVDTFERMVGGIDKLFEQRVAASERRAEQTREDLGALTPEGRERAVQGRFTREALMKDMASAGVNQFIRFIAGASYLAQRAAGRTPQEAYQREMGLIGWQGDTPGQRRGAERFLRESTITDDLLQQVRDEIKAANQPDAFRNVGSRVQRQPERTEVPPQAQRVIERPMALVVDPQIMREPGHPELPGIPASVQEEAGTQGWWSRLVEETVRQRQATEEQLKAQREAVDATREQTEVIRNQGGQATQQATTIYDAPSGLAPVPQVPAVIVQPKDETAETAFSVN